MKLFDNITNLIVNLGLDLDNDTIEEIEEYVVAKSTESTVTYSDEYLARIDNTRRKRLERESKAFEKEINRDLTRFHGTTIPVQEVQVQQQVEVEVECIDPFIKSRTEQENIVAESYSPQIVISEATAKALDINIVEIQQLAELLEKHIVASTLGIDNLVLRDYDLIGKSFFTMVVGVTSDNKSIYSPSVRLLKDDKEPYSYNFNQSHKIHSVFTNRWKQKRIVNNRNVLEY